MPIKGFVFNNNTPIYLQISKYYQAKVFIGEIEPGDVIPSRRELAGSFGVNLNTVQKAYAYMEEIGLICTEKNKQSKRALDGLYIQHEVCKYRQKDGFEACR